MLVATLKLLSWTLLCLGVTAYVVIKAVRAMRAGKPYTFSFLDGGLLFHGKQVAPQWMLVAAAVYLTGVGALLAWPLGLYEWLAAQASGCRDLVAVDELAEIGGAGFDEASVYDFGTVCRMNMATADFARFEVEIDGRLGYRRNVEIRARGFGGTQVAVRTPSGAPMTRVDTPTLTYLVFAHGHGGAEVLMSRERFDEQDVERVIALVDARRDAILPYAEAAEPASELSNTLRARLPFLFLGAVFLLIVAGIAVAVIRRNRAMRRALEEDDV